MSGTAGGRKSAAWAADNAKVRSAKHADARRQTVKQIFELLGSAFESATVLRVVVNSTPVDLDMLVRRSFYCTAFILLLLPAPSAL
jgi:hypothetical protein